MNRRPQSAVEVNNNEFKKPLVKKPSTILEESECNSSVSQRRRKVRHTRIKTAPSGKIQKKYLVNRQEDSVGQEIRPKEKFEAMKEVKNGNNTTKKCFNDNLDALKDHSIDRKLKISIEKILTSMDNIRMLVETGVSPPDGAEDLARRKKRAVEFSARFSRVYLYQIGRQVTLYFAFFLYVLSYLCFLLFRLRNFIN